MPPPDREGGAGVPVPPLGPGGQGSPCHPWVLGAGPRHAHCDVLCTTTKAKAMPPPYAYSPRSSELRTVSPVLHMQCLVLKQGPNLRGGTGAPRPPGEAALPSLAQVGNVTGRVIEPGRTGSRRHSRILPTSSLPTPRCGLPSSSHHRKLPLQITDRGETRP